MKIEQIYTSCLAQGAYYIESAGEAAIIDPLRETEPYLKIADERQTKIKYIFETHFHADFVSGHIDLAAKTNATIVFGPNAMTEYKIHSAKDGEVFTLGKIKIKALHTPGHTLESTTYLVLDEYGKQQAIFSGDTLFIGDVGRPDLAAKADLSTKDLAGMLYDSLRNKIMPLENHIIVYPAHGAGSACGKNLSTETYATLGNQKAFNYALQPMSKEAFIEQLTTGLTQPPQYFPENVKLNKKGYSSIDEIMKRALTPLKLNEFESKMKEGMLVLDTRSPQIFNKGFVPSALNIGLNGGFAPWVGALVVDITRPILLVTEEGKEEESVQRLARVGYDNVKGYLKGGIETWKNAARELETIHSIHAVALEHILKEQPESQVIDVRKPTEFSTQHLEGAQNYPLVKLKEQLHHLDPNETYYIHCLGGYRSMIASSIMKANGFKNIIEIIGGYNALKTTSIPKTESTCSSTK